MNHTTRTGRETMAYKSYKWSTAYDQCDLRCLTSGMSRTTRTGRETMAYKSYDWYDS